MATWTNTTKNSTSFTNVTKTDLSVTEQDLLIGEGYMLSIGNGFTLLIQAQGAGWTNIIKN